MKYSSFNKNSGRGLAFLLLSMIAAESCFEFYNVAWGTGKAMGQFAITWLVLFAAFVLFCCLTLLLTGLALWNPSALFSLRQNLLTLREKLGWLRWLFAALVLFLPVYFLQYTAGGLLFRGIYTRVLIWGIAIFLLTLLFTKGERLLGWKPFLSALLLTSSSFVIAVEFIDVTSYPFSLGWSEGNRLWDYSILFGRDLYLYPADKEIPVLLEFGRQVIGGFPFLFPGVTIGAARFWVALTFILPYFLLGLLLFRFAADDWKNWLLLTVWVFLFLKQGPIHPPLVLSAAATALAWNFPLAVGIPLVAGAGYFASITRSTWMFAPAIWIVMLEFAGGSFNSREQAKKTWLRSILLGIAGILGGFIYPLYIEPALSFYVGGGANIVPVVTNAQSAPEESLFSIIISIINRQPLLWYRLLPNSTYKTGILLALVLAVTPLLLILLHLLFKKQWTLTPLQKTSLLLPLLVFLVIGLVASTKIGGGGDLHNMDMFLIALVLIAALAWFHGGGHWLEQAADISTPAKIVLLIFFILPGLSSLMIIRPRSLPQDRVWLMKLADVNDADALGLLPNENDVEFALQKIQDQIEIAKPQGDILFIDQRQLLTFGIVQNVHLIPEYDKKVLINEAMSANAAYFKTFYQDISAQRFSLIITQPIHRNAQDDSNHFGEENNAWVKWVSNPLLCYYEETVTLRKVGIQLLVPIPQPLDCAEQIPSEALP